MEVYWNDYSAKSQNQIAMRGANQQSEAQPQLPNNSLSGSARGELTNYSQPVANLKAQSRKVNPAQQAMQNFAPNEPATELNTSKVMSTEAEFGQLIGEANDGMLARFVQNKLRLMFWHRLVRDPQLVFGAQLNLAQVSGGLRAIVEGKTQAPRAFDRYYNRNNSGSGPAESKSSGSLLPEEICVVILDDNANPIVVSNPEFREQLNQPRAVKGKGAGKESPLARVARDLKHPFVATEIGEALPHWEVAAYLLNPDLLKQRRCTIRTLARPVDRRVARRHDRRQLADRERPQPPVDARPAENRFRQQRFARTENAAHFHPHVFRIARRGPRERSRRSSVPICTSSPPKPRG